MKTIEEDYVEVRRRYLQILRHRKVANKMLRRANLRTMFSRESFSAEGWRRLFFASSRETHVRQRIEAAKDEIRSGDDDTQTLLQFLLLERRNWPIITGRMLLAYRPNVSFENLRKVHAIWAGQQEYMFSPKVFWKVVFPLFALISGSQAHLFGAVKIPDRILEHRYFHAAIVLVLGYTSIYFLSHIVIVSRARRDDEAMGWALISAEVFQGAGASSQKPSGARDLDADERLGALVSTSSGR